MKADTPARKRKKFFLTVDTELWDDDVLWELPVKERKRVKSAMMWGRPLPPRLAPAAVQHARKLQTQAWYGYYLLGLGLVFGLVAGTVAAQFVWWLDIGFVFCAVAWLLIGGIWLRAVVRAGRVVREGRWPGRG